MSWSLTRPNVRLRVTKFAPDVLLEPAGLTDDQRAAHKAKRERECAKVEPPIEYPDWRLEELARKYAPEDAYEEYYREEEL